MMYDKYLKIWCSDSSDSTVKVVKLPYCGSLHNKTYVDPKYLPNLPSTHRVRGNSRVYKDKIALITFIEDVKPPYHATLNNIA